MWKKEAYLLILNKDECLIDGVEGLSIFLGGDEDSILILFLYV